VHNGWLWLVFAVGVGVIAGLLLDRLLEPKDE
jgi:hypothetical protein